MGELALASVGGGGSPRADSVSGRPLYRTEALVLRTWRMGEADRLISMLSREYGRLRAVAKGARKATSRHGAVLEAGSLVELQLYKGRELDTITQANSLEARPSYRTDLRRYARASVMLEAIECAAIERHPAPAMFDLLAGALKALEAGDRPLLVAAFVLKLLALEGLAPQLDACTGCGSFEDLVAFDPNLGGARCDACRSGTPLPVDGFGLMELMLSGRVALALQEPESPLTRSIESLAVASLERHLERRLRSLEAFDVAAQRLMGPQTAAT